MEETLFMSIEAASTQQQKTNHTPIIRTMLSICPQVRNHVLDLAKEKFSNQTEVCPNQLGDFLLEAFGQAKHLPNSNVVSVVEKTDIPKIYNFGKVVVVELSDKSIVNVSANQYRRFL